MQRELLLHRLGSFAVLLGLNLFWAIVAILSGHYRRGIHGLHAVQGPRLGVPQMIQSRGQFGFYVAVVMFVAGILLDVGYMAGGLVVGAQSLQGVTSGSIQVWIVTFAGRAGPGRLGVPVDSPVQPYLVVICWAASPSWAWS